MFFSFRNKSASEDKFISNFALFASAPVKIKGEVGEVYEV